MSFGAFRGSRFEPSPSINKKSEISIHLFNVSSSIIAMLSSFEYNEISDLEYKNLTKELDKLDLSNEKNKISEYKIYQHRSTYEEDKLMDYMNREELNIWYNHNYLLKGEGYE